MKDKIENRSPDSSTRIEAAKFDENWYLGFFGFIGMYKIPEILNGFTADGSWWDILSVLWFLWFLHFLPNTKS